MQKLIIKAVLVKNYKSISQFLALKTQESLREAAFLDSSEDTTTPTTPSSNSPLPGSGPLSQGGREKVNTGEWNTVLSRMPLPAGVSGGGSWLLGGLMMI